MKRFICVAMSILLVICTGTIPAFAGTENVLNISADDEKYEISDKLYGSFIEDISYACDGGLVSNLVNNDSFEYEFNKTTAWKADGIELTADTENPMNENNPTYARITSKSKGTLTNTGYTELYEYKSYDRDEEKAQTPDMGFKADTEYALSCYIMNKSFEGKVSVYLDSDRNKSNVTVLDITNTNGIWTKITTTLTSVAQEDGGLTFEFDGNGEICLDFVTLVPTDSYGYGANEWKYTSLRTDLYEALKQLSPAFIRFPGGCLAEGDSLENLYDWKETIGPLEERVQFYNLWRDDVGRDYINTMAMGYHEFFQLCKDLNAEALPILNVGLTCQGRAAYDDHVIALQKSEMTEEEWETYLTETRNIPENNTDERKGFTDYIDGLNINSRDDFEAYLDTIALRPDTAEWDAYVQDILDLIEYANGDAETTYWGALRAANGSEEPFNLKYIGLGNENWGEIYERNFKALYKEVKKAYPEITVISSSGTWLEGDAYEENWQWINSDYSDTIVDEHYYTGDGYLFDHNDRYDSFDRDGAHVFIGEYAATAKGVGTIQTKSNMHAAIEEASYLTGVERNGDVVEMASYAPTFAKVNAQCWNVNLIWFDSQEVVLTPSYYVQMLYSNNYGSTYLKSAFENGETIQNGIYESVTMDKETETLYVKLVNTTGKKQSVSVNLSGFDNISRISSQSISGKYKSACNEIGKLTTYPVENELTAGNSVSVDMGKYDVTVLRIAYGSNDGVSLYTLPDNISTMAEPTGYTPDIIKIGVPCIIAGVVVIAGALAGIIVFVKKRKAKNKD
ncbi:MAG: alpha-L-arabinofuranosidase C-terminal domain-containing protein [Eubacterium sp.]